MKVKTTDGQEYNWTMPTKVSRGNRRKTSNLHAFAKELLGEKYPNVVFYEEVPIIVEGKQKLYLDFYSPTLFMAIEVNGRQHYVFNPYHHKAQMSFRKQIQNDRKKREWCELNNIELIILPYDKQKEWGNIIYDERR